MRLRRPGRERRSERPKRERAEERAPVHHTSARASPFSRIGTSLGWLAGSLSERRDAHQRGDAQSVCYARLLLRRCHRASDTVQPLYFTFSQRLVGSDSYRIVSPLATTLSLSNTNN